MKVIRGLPWKHLTAQKYSVSSSIQSQCSIFTGHVTLFFQVEMFLSPGSSDTLRFCFHSRVTGKVVSVLRFHVDDVMIYLLDDLLLVSLPLCLK